jgi:transcriptional regulator with XRE-family HTH domain
MNCPSILELTTPRLSAATRQHVADCLRCQALLAAWEADPATDEPELDVTDVELPVWRPRADPRSPAAAGAVHTVAAPAQDVFLLGLVIDHDDQQATVMPLNTEVHWAADWDVLLDDDVLGYPVMVEAWNPVDVLTEQLIDQVAVVEQAELFVELYERSLASADAPEGLPDGPRIDSEDDPRLLFREHERERVRPYGEPARVINMGESLGQLLRAVREERGRAAEELAGAAGLELVALKRIEEDREDLQGGLSIKGFRSLLAELELPASEVFLGYVEEAAFLNDRHVVTEHAVVYARRRQRTSVRQDRGSEAERRARAKAWVERLRQELAAGR